MRRKGKGINYATPEEWNACSIVKAPPGFRESMATRDHQVPTLAPTAPTSEMHRPAVVRKATMAPMAPMANKVGSPVIPVVPAGPSVAEERKGRPVFSAFIKYFPKAIMCVAELSRVANEQHNPGTEPRWDRSKSGDEKDALMRHLIDSISEDYDDDGQLHSAKVAWRAMANLEKQLELEEGGSK